MYINSNLISLDYWHNTINLKAREVQEWPPGIKKVVARIAWNSAGTAFALVGAAQKIIQLVVHVFIGKLYTYTEGFWRRILSAPRLEAIRQSIEPAKQEQVKAKITDLARHATISTRAALHLDENRPYMAPTTKDNVHGFMSESAAREILQNLKQEKAESESEGEENFGDLFAPLDSPQTAQEPKDKSHSQYLIYRGLSNQPGYHLMWKDVTNKFQTKQIAIDPGASLVDITALAQKELEDPKMELIHPEENRRTDTITCSDFEATQILEREKPGTCLWYYYPDGDLKGIQHQEDGTIVGVDLVDDAFKKKCMKLTDFEKAVQRLGDEKSLQSRKMEKSAENLDKNGLMRFMRHSYPCSFEYNDNTFRNARAAMLREKYNFASIFTKEMDLFFTCSASEATELDRALHPVYEDALKDFYSKKENKITIQLVNYQILQEKFKADSPLRPLLDNAVKEQKWEIEAFESKEKEPRDLEKMMLIAIANDISLKAFGKTYFNYFVKNLDEENEESSSISEASEEEESDRESGEIDDDSYERSEGEVTPCSSPLSYPSTPVSQFSTPVKYLGSSRATTPRSAFKSLSPAKYSLTPRKLYKNEAILRFVRKTMIEMAIFLEETE